MHQGENANHEWAKQGEHTPIPSPPSLSPTIITHFFFSFFSFSSFFSFFFVIASSSKELLIAALHRSSHECHVLVAKEHVMQKRGWQLERTQSRKLTLVLRAKLQCTQLNQ